MTVATSKQASDEGRALSGSHADAPSQSSLSRPDGFDPAQLVALAERCEAAPWPDRDLDTEILWFVNRSRFSRGYWNAASGLPRALEDMPHPNGGLGWIGAQCVAPTYTASIDAAMTLVPEGHGCMLSVGEDGKAGAAVHPFGKFVRARFASTAALAICTAALRASAARVQA